MKKRILFLLLAVAMALSLVPMMAFTAFAADAIYDITNGTDIMVDAVKDAASGETITVTGDAVSSDQINLNIPAGVKVVWEATLTSSAIRGSALVVSGDGALEITGTITFSSEATNTIAVFMSGNAALTVKGGSLSGGGYAIQCLQSTAGPINITNGSQLTGSVNAIYVSSAAIPITIENSTIASESDDSSDHVIYAGKCTVSLSGATIKSSAAGIYAKEVTVESGENAITAAKECIELNAGTEDNYGALTIAEGATLTATATSTASSVYGIYLKDYNGVVVDGTLKVTAPTDDGSNNYAVYGMNTTGVSFTVGETGAVTANAYCGIAVSTSYCAVTVDGGMLTATGSDGRAIYSTGVVTVKNGGRVDADSSGSNAVGVVEDIIVDGGIINARSTGGRAIYVTGDVSVSGVSHIRAEGSTDNYGDVSFDMTDVDSYLWYSGTAAPTEASDYQYLTVPEVDDFKSTYFEFASGDHVKRDIDTNNHQFYCNVTDCLNEFDTGTEAHNAELTWYPQSVEITEETVFVKLCDTCMVYVADVATATGYGWSATVTPAEERSYALGSSTRGPGNMVSVENNLLEISYQTATGDTITDITEVGSYRAMIGNTNAYVPFEVTPQEYSIDVNAGEGGSASASATAAAEGTSVTITVTPDAGYEVDRVYYTNDNGTEIDITGDQFTMPAYDVTVNATFSKIDYTITVDEDNVPTGVSITPGATTAKVDDEITLTVTGIPFGYALKISVNGTESITATEDGDYTFTMPAANVTITAELSEAFTKVDGQDNLYTDGNDNYYQKDEETGKFTEVHVHEESDGSYTVFQLWDGTSQIANGNFALRADVVNAATDVNVYHSNVEICLNGYKYTAENNIYTMYVRETVTIGDCTEMGSMLNLWCDTDSNVTLNGITANAVAVIEATLTVNGGTYTYILPTSGTVNLNGAIEIKGSTEGAGLRPSDSATINLGIDFAGTGKITVDESDLNDALTFGETWTFITSGATDANKTRFVYHKTAEELNDGVTNEIQTVLGDDTSLSFKAVHVHDDGTEYVGWDGTSNINGAGNYVLSVDIENGHIATESSDETISVTLCLNGHTVSGVLMCRYADLTVLDCSTEKAGNIETLWALGAEDSSVTLQDVKVSMLANSYSTVYVYGGKIGTISGVNDYYSGKSAVVHLYGEPIITGYDGFSGIELNDGLEIHLDKDFSGTNGKTGDDVDTRITVGVDGDYPPLAFGTPLTFVTSGGTEANKDMFVYDKTAAELDDGVTTEIQTVLDEENGTLSFKAVHKHDDGTEFDKALDLSLEKGEITEDGNYVVTAGNPYDADAARDATTVDPNVNASVCLNGMDCGNAMIAANSGTDLTVYDHKDDEGDFKGQLYEVRVFGNGAVINGGNFEVISGGDASITFNDGTVADDLSVVSGGSAVTLNVNGGVIGAIAAQASENGGSVTVNLRGSPVITGDGSAFFQSGGERLDTEGHIVINPGTILNIAEGFTGSADGDGEKITVQFWNKSAPLQHEISVGKDIAFATGTDLDGLKGTFAYYDSSRNVSVVLSDDESTLSFHLETITVDGEEIEAIDKIPTGGNGIYENEEGEEVYIPTPDDDDPNYIEVTDDNKDGIYEDNEGNKYIPVDTDNDGKVDDSLTDKNKDGIFEDDNNTPDDEDDDTYYVPDGEGGVTPVTPNGDGTYTDPENDDKYIPDQDGDGKPEKEKEDEPGIFEGSDEDEDKEYVVDPEKVPPYVEVEKNDDGTYTDPENDDKYIPDQDGDGKPEKEKEDEPGIFEGSDDEQDKEYVVDPEKVPPYVEVEKNDDETYTDPGEDGEEGTEDDDKYIPDQDGDGEAEKVEKNPDGSYTDKGDPEDEDDDTHYIPDGNGGFIEVEKNPDGSYTDPATGEVYKPDADGKLQAYAATPVIAPESGSFSSSQRVTISTSTVGAEIYYTTDGSDPSATNGKLYEGEFSISKTTTIRAIAVKDGVNASEIAEAEFTKASSETGGDGDDDVVIRPTYYDIIIDDSANGGVTSKHSSATAGTTVTLTVEPGEGYELRKLTVTDKDGRITVVSAKGDGSYTFKMPNRDVYVKASFVKDGTSSVHICPSEDFRDVNTNLWYHEAIDFVLENGYMNGMGNGMFAPASRLNRAMIVQVLYKMEGQPEVDTVYGFTDVAPDAWYADAVNWAAENEIVNGYGDTFGPLDPITREQMVTILYRYAEYKGLDTGARLDLSIFRDGGKVSSWASDAVEWAVAVGLISTEGKGNGFFEPAGTATRAEVAQVLMNYCTKILNN